MRYLVILLIGILIIAGLAKLFPDSLSNRGEIIGLVSSLAVLTLVGSGVFYRFHNNIGYVVKSLLIWVGIFAISILLYGYRNEISSGLSAGLMPSRVVSKENYLEVQKSQDGHYYIDTTINGFTIRFLVDTGASDIVIPVNLVERMNIDPRELDFSRTYNTANGTTRGAPVILKELKIGNLSFKDVKASVNQSEMSNPLLGMSFLENMGGYEVRNGVLKIWY